MFAPTDNKLCAETAPLVLKLLIGFREKVEIEPWVVIAPEFEMLNKVAEPL